MPSARQRRLRTWGFWAVPVLLMLLPLATNDYTQFIINGMLISVLVTLGFSLVIGNLGQLAFANTAFFGNSGPMPRRSFRPSSACPGL